MSNHRFLHLNPATICRRGVTGRAVETNLARLAIDTMREQYESCRTALHKADPVAWEFALHSLKGTLALLQSNRAVGQLNEIEVMDVRAPQTASALEVLHRMLGNIEDELRCLLPRN